jgi:hypothetical protein
MLRPPSLTHTAVRPTKSLAISLAGFRVISSPSEPSNKLSAYEDVAFAVIIECMLGNETFRHTSLTLAFTNELTYLPATRRRVIAYFRRASDVSWYKLSIFHTENTIIPIIAATIKPTKARRTNNLDCIWRAFLTKSDAETVGKSDDKLDRDVDMRTTR